MTKRRLALLAAALLVGCQSASNNLPKTPAAQASAAPRFTPIATADPIDPAWRKPPAEAFRLGAGDELEIEILGEAGSRAITKVGLDGRIYFYLLRGVLVANLTVEQAKKEIERELLAYVRYPSVSLQVREVASQRVWVLGRLNKPGVYPISAPMTIVDVVARAGGLYSSRFTGTSEELADLQHGFFVRKGRPIAVDFRKLLKEGDMSQNLYLQGDDYIYLPSSLSSEVQVMGSVMNPRTIGFMDQVSLISALSSAGGPAGSAELSQVAIVRGSLSKPSVAIVNAMAIISGKAPDVQLQPHDIVYVPARRYDSITGLARTVVTSFVQAVSANEGNRAGNSNAAPVSVNVGLQ